MPEPELSLMNRFAIGFRGITLIAHDSSSYALIMD